MLLIGLKDWKSPCSTPEALLLKDIHIHLVVSLRQTHDPMKLWFRRKTKKSPEVSTSQ